MPNSRARALLRRLGLFALVAAVALLSAGCLTESTTTTAAGDTTGTTAAEGGVFGR